MILSIENHASKPVQVKMAKYLEEILGDMLVKEKLSDLDNPSPEQLFNKFILKGKILANLLPIKSENQKYLCTYYHENLDEYTALDPMSGEGERGRDG